MHLRDDSETALRRVWDGKCDGSLTVEIGGFTIVRRLRRVISEKYCKRASTVFDILI